MSELRAACVMEPVEAAHEIDRLRREVAELREVIAHFNAEVAECNYPVQYLAVDIEDV